MDIDAKTIAALARSQDVTMQEAIDLIESYAAAREQIAVCKAEEQAKAYVHAMLDRLEARLVQSM